jgi:hypothetical protein
LVPQLIVFVLLLPQLLLQSAYPLVSILFSLASSAVLLVGMPFIQGGMLGMAEEALDGRSSLSRFVAAGKENYLSLLVGYVLLLVVNGVLGAIGFAAGFGAVLTHDAVRIAFIAVAALVGLAYLLLAFFVQFYGQAIVVEERSALAAFKRSYRVVRENLLKAAGYTVLSILIGGLSGGVYAAVSMLASPGSTSTLPTLSLPLLVVVGVVAAVLGSVVSAFMLTFSVAVYDELTAVSGDQSGSLIE